MNYHQGSTPSFFFSIKDIPTLTSVISFSAYEWMSHYYTVKLTLSTLIGIAVADGAIGKEAVLSIVDNNDAGGMTRHFHGIIAEFEQVGSCNGKQIYEVELVPTLWRLTLRKNCRIFQEMNVQDIVKRLLKEGGITSDRYRFALLNKERMRGFCVQYRESDFDFVSRLLEEEGIFYFFQHSADKHILIFSDHKSIHVPISGRSSISFNSGGRGTDTSSIKALSFSQRLGTKAFTHRNFNFKRPSLELTTGKAGTNKDEQQLEVYDYPALHTTQERGDKLAKVRMEELAAQQNQGNGQTSCCRLIPGHTFTLVDHDSPSFNASYLVVSVMHCGMQPQSLEEMSGEAFSYDAQFTVIPASVPFRPTTTVNKPTIPGVQTAIVVGPPGEDIYTDEYGRIKVRFHWDREAENNGKSSCWLRINQPWSGSHWGMIAIPRIGDEVLVGFLEGDPDRPIMLGNVNNADSPALYELPANQTQVGIRTRSTPGGGPDNFNELRFEDKKGGEEVFLQAEKDLNLLVKNHKNEKVQASKTETVGADKTVNVGKSFDITVGEAFSITCGNSKISMDEAGNVTIRGTRFLFEACGPVLITGDPVDIN